VSIFQTDSLPGRIVKTTDGAEFLWFSGTDYLGMGHNEDFRRLIVTGLENYGNHFGSSRNNSLRLAIYEETERRLAGFLNAPSALIVSSGMWAGQIVMKEIEAVISENPRGAGIQYHYAPTVHPALWGNHFVASSQSWENWAIQTVEKINTASRDSTHIICSDAIGSPMVASFDFSVFNGIQNTSTVWLIVDESHSLGVLGAMGSGLAGKFPPDLAAQAIFVSSLNKALGIPAGAVWGSKRVTDFLRNSPWYAGASPPAPTYAYALNGLLGRQVYKQMHALLIRNIRYFSSQITSLNLFDSVHDYPVFCSKNPALFGHLLDNGIMASCFAYPSPADAPVTRIAITVLHQKEDLDRLAEVCKKFQNN
jgi:7-keto-8-aminopelargonate synthetase-like enzyme